MYGRKKNGGTAGTTGPMPCRRNYGMYKAFGRAYFAGTSSMVFLSNCQNGSIVGM